MTVGVDDDVDRAGDLLEVGQHVSHVLSVGWHGAGWGLGAVVVRAVVVACGDGGAGGGRAV
jgi:hypothetical protein